MSLGTEALDSELHDHDHDHAGESQDGWLLLPGLCMSDSHERALKALERRGRLRALAPRSGLDFSSNDYLGLASSDALRSAVEAAIERGVAIGAGGSRLLRGNDPEHEALEAEAAAFFGAESCLYFGGGFVANTRSSRRCRSAAISSCMTR